jgi:hypothetical protein
MTELNQEDRAPLDIPQIPTRPRSAPRSGCAATISPKTQFEKVRKMTELNQEDTEKKPSRRSRSDNKGGRPVGSKNRAKVLSKWIFERDFNNIREVIVKAAIDGDLIACRLVVDKLVENQRGRLLRFNLPVLKSMDDVAAALNALIQCVGSGLLTISEANELSALIERQGEALQASDFERRLAAIEAQAPKLIGRG